MKLATFYQAQKIVKALEEVKKIKDRFNSGNRTVTINLEVSGEYLVKTLKLKLDEIQTELEEELNHIK